MASALASAALGGVSSAMQGRSERKAAEKQAKQTAEENAKDRLHQKEMAERQIKRYQDAASSWGKYDFGAKPLMLRQQPAAPAQPSAPMQPAPGMQESMMDRPSTNPLLQLGFR
jgi:hypothetical protein